MRTGRGGAVIDNFDLEPCAFQQLDNCVDNHAPKVSGGWDKKGAERGDRSSEPCCEDFALRAPYAVLSLAAEYVGGPQLA
jgi:hypothetical protein